MRFRRTVSWALGLGAASVALILVAWLVWWGVGSWQLRRAQADLRAAGLPMTAAEILPEAVAEADNAAPLLLRVEQLIKEMEKREGCLRPCPGDGRKEGDPALFDEARMGELRAQMAWPETREMLLLLRVAAEKPAARFERDYSKGPGIEMGAVSGLLSGTRWLGTAAWLKANDGEASGAAADLLACARLASFSLDDTFLVTWLVGVSVDVMAMIMTGSVLAALPEGTFQLSDWQPLFDSWAAHAGVARARLVRAFDGERIFSGAWVFGLMENSRNFFRGTSSIWKTLAADDFGLGPGWLLLAYNLPFNGFVAADHAAYLRLMLGWSEAIAAFEPGGPAHHRLIEEIPRTALLTRLTTPALDGVISRLGDYLVQMQLAVVGLALEEFRARNGAYPESLDELRLPPGATTDPFGGKPFVYRPGKASVLLYSVGQDGADGGGQTRGKSGERDVVWAVRRGGAE